MRIISTLLVSAFLLGGMATAAFAQDLNTTESCTVVRGGTVATDDERWKYCDIYSRQFQHREKMIELKESMENRADNYKSSFKPVIDSYKEELTRHHASLGSE